MNKLHKYMKLAPV